MGEPCLLEAHEDPQLLVEVVFLNGRRLAEWWELVRIPSQEEDPRIVSSDHIPNLRL
jgi:hypothetical protein